MEKLIAKMREIEADPNNRNPPGSFYLYKKSARRRLAVIAQQITHLLAESKKTENGERDMSCYTSDY